MKGTYLFMLVMFFCVNIFAQKQKSYVTMIAELYKPGSVRLSGDVPTNMQTHYSADDLKKMDEKWGAGGIINKLSENGFVVDQLSSVVDGARFYTIYLFSKSVGQIDNKENNEIKEVARYNQQGLQVKESDKGLQIIVYSNYTIKTVVVQ